MTAEEAAEAIVSGNFSEARHAIQFDQGVVPRHASDAVRFALEVTDQLGLHMPHKQAVSEMRRIMERA